MKKVGVEIDVAFDCRAAMARSCQIIRQDVCNEYSYANGQYEDEES
jgi:hypothetical protein